jgi:hypothetical protein
MRARTMDAMALAMALEDFERDMIPHLHEFSPHHAQMLGENGLRQVVRLGIERARPYGLTNPGLLRFYVELMFMYGSFFDTDPLLPWAGEVLHDGAIADPQARATRLYDRMSWYYDTVSGPDLAFDRRALHSRAQMLAGDSLPGDPRFELQLVGALFAIHPARALYVGESRLQALVRAAVEGAERHAIGTASGIALLAFLMFTKGHGFASDPLLPWARAALDDGTGDHASRAERLTQAFHVYLAQISAPLH